VKILRGPKNALQKCHFWLKKSEFSSKVAFLGVHVTKILSPLKAAKKSLASLTLAMPVIDCQVKQDHTTIQKVFLPF